MEAPISDYLHSAAAVALAGKDYSLALNLIELLSQGHTIPSAQANTVSKNNTITPSRLQLTLDDGCSDSVHGREFWQEIITTQWIPLCIDRGLIAFTTPNLMEWIDNASNVQLLPGDLADDSKTKYYRRMISNALGKLKNQNILASNSQGKIYRITAQAFEANRFYRGGQ